MKHNSIGTVLLLVVSFVLAGCDTGGRKSSAAGVAMAATSAPANPAAPTAAIITQAQVQQIAAKAATDAVQELVEGDDGLDAKFSVVNERLDAVETATAALDERLSQVAGETSKAAADVLALEQKLFGNGKTGKERDRGQISYLWAAAKRNEKAIKFADDDAHGHLRETNAAVDTVGKALVDLLEAGEKPSYEARQRILRDLTDPPCDGCTEEVGVDPASGF